MKKETKEREPLFEEVDKFIKESGREQPGASLQREDQREERQPVPSPSESQTAPNPLYSSTAPNPRESGEDFKVRKHKVGRKPTLPMKAEIADHYLLHLHYRSWCKHCVVGKARATQHRRNYREEESLGVTLHADYAFMGGDYNEQEEGMQASLIMYDDDKDSFWAVGVDKTWASDAMVKYTVGVID